MQYGAISQSINGERVDKLVKPSIYRNVVSSTAYIYSFCRLWASNSASRSARDCEQAAASSTCQSIRSSSSLKRASANYAGKCRIFLSYNRIRRPSGSLAVGAMVPKKACTACENSSEFALPWVTTAISWRADPSRFQVAAASSPNH